MRTGKMTNRELKQLAMLMEKLLAQRGWLTESESEAARYTLEAVTSLTHYPN